MQNKWNNEEIEFLKLYYPTHGIQYCFNYLNRSKDSIEVKARRLNLSSTRTKSLYSEINIREIILISKSLTEVLIKMGLKPAGGNYSVISKYIKKYNIDISHFETIKERNDRIGFRTLQKKLSDVLTENSYFSRSQLCKRLISEKLLEYKCQKCNNNGEWMDKKITLQLDHINGINNDNRLENLQFLCPNCHSQTNTYAGKNNKK